MEKQKEETFLIKIEKERNNSIIESNYTYLDEILLSIFDKEFSKYSESKQSKKQNLILKHSLKIFKDCVSYIEK